MFENPLFKSAPVGMALLDRKGRFIGANDFFLDTFHSELMDLFSLSLTDLFSFKDKHSWSEEAGKLLTGDVPRSWFLLESLSDENSGIWQVSLSLIEELDSLSLLAAFQDISSFKEVESDLISLRDKAEKATETKSAFLANMTHEIRTPIHTIIGMSDLLKETALDDEQEEYASQVRYSASVLLALVNDILDFSKIEAGHMALENTDYNLTEVVENAVDLVSLQAHKKGVDVGLFIDNRLPEWVMGDPVRFQQIIVNLFNNAVKFTQDGEVVVKLEYVSHEGKTVQMRCGVQDTGIGIASDKLASLFEAFKQADSSTTRKYGGTGLGLSISRNLVGLMGGELTVASEEGEGTEFFFTIPVLRSEKDKSGKVSPVLLPFASRRFLVVDDNKSVRDITTAYIREWGGEVDEASDAVIGLEFLRKCETESWQYDLALIDQMLPGIDGWQMASEIKEKFPGSVNKLVLMTLKGRGVEEAKMKLLGWYDEYLRKPVRRADILSILLHQLAIEGYVETAEKTDSGNKQSEDDYRVKGDHTVLIAEDHEVNQVLFRTIMEKVGFKVILASNGVEAVQYTLSEKPDLVFMDVQMPLMNGYEATRKIRASGEAVPVIAVTANAVKEEKDRCLESGMSDFLTKPFQKKDLVPVIKRWLITDHEDEPEEPGELEELGELEDFEELEELSDDSGMEDESERPEIFDFEKAKEVFLGDVETLLSLFDPFCERVEANLGLIDNMLTDEMPDANAISSAAHGIKGSALNIQAAELGRTALVIEKAGKNDLIDDVRKGMPDLHQAYNDFKNYIKRYQ